ncbi:MAG: hypothetical protein NTW86_30710 [Candidatus Sumerlaeota bacterium]|nr:hypothetical protein [Candidatus Sumerlaeota bacterium]
MSERAVLRAVFIVTGAWAVLPSLSPGASPVVTPLASQVAAIHWKTERPAFACVEYGEKALESDRKQGQLFPLESMSPDHYTKMPSRNHNLCLADLKPDTFYHVRVWNKDEDGAETVSPAVQFRTPKRPTAVYRFTPQSFGLQLSEPWDDLDPATRAKALDAPYIRVIRVFATWDELQPDGPDKTDWSVVEGPLADLEKAIAGRSKFIRLALTGARHIEKQEQDAWYLEGVEVIKRPRKPNKEAQDTGQDAKENIVRWDPQYLCRWLTLIKEAGSRLDSPSSPDPHPLIALVSVASVSNTGEMDMTRPLLDAYKATGYSDAQIAKNMEWSYRATLQVFAEAFPHMALAMNMGTLNVADGKADAGQAILDEAVATYGKRLQLGVTGSGGSRGELLKQYGGRAVTAIMTERPSDDCPDPAADVQAFFDKQAWPFASGLGAVYMHADALGISSKRFGDSAELKQVLAGVEQRFAALRRAASE